jgi:hypothetical protein
MRIASRRNLTPGGFMDSQPVGNNVSTQQVEAVVRESAALAGALRAARAMRLALLAALFVMILAIVWTVYGKYRQLTSEENLNKVKELAQQQFEKHKEQYVKQVQLLMDKVREPVLKAFSAQAEKDMPKFLRVVEDNRQPFMDGMEKKITAKLKDHYGGLRKDYEQAVRKEFPNVSDKTIVAIMDNMDHAVERLLKKYYVDDLRDELLVMFHTWDTFPPAAPPGKDLTVMNEFKLALLDLLAHKWTHPQR